MARSDTIAKSKRIRLATVGYSGISLADLVTVLVHSGIDALIDVRELPLSRRPGFSKTPLSSALREAGIRYVHLRALGNPREHRRRYQAGQVAVGARGYRRHVRRQGAEALGQLAGEVVTGACCLLCVEADPDHCHRLALTDLLRDAVPTLVVEHLRVQARPLVRLTA